MAIIEVCIFPIGEGTSVSEYVAGCEQVLADRGMKFRLNPMGTTIEGDADEIFAAIREMQESVFARGAKRVYSVIKCDDRRDKQHSMEYKIKSVTDKL